MLSYRLFSRTLRTTPFRWRSFCSQSQRQVDVEDILSGGYSNPSLREDLLSLKNIQPRAGREGKYLSDRQFLDLIRVIEQNSLGNYIQPSLLISLDQKFFKIVRAYVNCPSEINPVAEYCVLLQMLLSADRQKTGHSLRMEPFLYIYLQPHCQARPDLALRNICTLARFFWRYGFQDPCLPRFLGEVLQKALQVQFREQEVSLLGRVYSMLLELNTAQPLLLERLQDYLPAVQKSPAALVDLLYADTLSRHSLPCQGLSPHQLDYLLSALPGLSPLDVPANQHHRLLELYEYYGLTQSRDLLLASLGECAPRPSPLHSEVSLVLDSLSIPHLREHRLSVYHVDLFLPGLNTVIEVNGPAHYLSACPLLHRHSRHQLTNPFLHGKYKLRMANLQKQGHRVCQLHFESWNELPGVTEKMALLRGLL